MKTEQGIVIEVIDKVAKIKVGRHNDCKNCGACPGDNNLILNASNEIGAKIGQRVVFEVKGDNVLKSAFVIFILPLIVTFIGALIGGTLAKYVGYNVHMLQIAGGIIAFILSMILIKLFDKAVRKSNKALPKIVDILGK
ncbi:SoxR reducing system RseC family protein [Clostridium sp. SHJSY1]|uniref:SoxR reducing system RseC family protein n=1 Tax=Clostridium sp. SHJSY1 TaxID=2942483 RepID=UPI002876EEAB|nr:SoxR reducing system RseC family protein [Clostridium sp. SHJSY1]MDS0524440.1 SoxR reducing system RseC family protein [Clostridium sp. SHJSY1]